MNAGLSKLRTLLGGFAFALATLPLHGQTPDRDEKKTPEPIPSIADKVQGLQRVEGFFPFYWDPKEGEILLEISRWDEEFLFVPSLSTGLGSNPVGLDRGQLGIEHVVRFQRIGPKVLLLARNLKFRAQTDALSEQRAVDESFATSVLWGTRMAAEDGDRALVDVSQLMLQDMHDVAGRLKRSGQGEFKLEEERSAVYLPRCKAFPENTELEATLTFSSSEPGPLVEQTAPAGRAVSLRQHYSLVKLPDDGYRPRRFDPRSSSNFIEFADYAAPIDQPLLQRWITRHRLQKKDPGAEISGPIEPLVYYVDPGAPEPIRSALIEGARWWNRAFESAGFRDAFQVEVLPEDADPMDVRYNVIQWVHRATRGWSYGGSVVDPRTGEIIKGHVTLGSLRVRHDRLLFDGLTADDPPANDPGCCGCGLAGVLEEGYLSQLDPGRSPTEVALSRIRQLAAHEVGHTLGFAHNFAASTYGDRASVMDYPAPRVKITSQGQLDLSDAYGVGVGAWDEFSVQYAYSDFPPQVDAQAALERLIANAAAQGMVYISDADARPAAAAHPLANLWDNGDDAVAELEHLMQVRRIALDRLGASQIAAGQPMSALEEVLVPVYLHHRYQVDAVAKLVGGSYYSYAVAGDGRVPLIPVPEHQQRRALRALMLTLQPAELAIDPRIIQLIPPTPYSSTTDLERFSGQTAPVFDPLGAARIAAEMTLANLLHPQRVSRLATTPDATTQLGAWEMIFFVVDSVSNTKDVVRTRAEAEVSRVVRDSLTQLLRSLADDTQASLAARSAARAGLLRMREYFKTQRRMSDADERHFADLMLDEIERFLTRPNPEAARPESLSPPPGSPIGSGR